jgi:hypothetical protein
MIRQALQPTPKPEHNLGTDSCGLLCLHPPLLIAVQEACARIGAVTGKGLAGLIKENYSAHVLYAAVSIILIANTINIGADIGAMAEAIRLIVPIPCGQNIGLRLVPTQNSESQRNPGVSPAFRVLSRDRGVLRSRLWLPGNPAGC